MLKIELKHGLERGFIDRNISAEKDFTPQFIINNPSKGEKVISTLKSEMESCDEFMFSVAFVNYGGINALLDQFKYLRNHGIKGRILVSQYQNFTEPKALRKLSSFENIEVRIVTEDQMNMHSKCYIFRKSDHYDVIIGSSNLTNSALCTNGEWNIKFNSSDSGEVVTDIIREFDDVFRHATPITDSWIDEYSEIYDVEKQILRSLKERSVIDENFGKIVPNSMQLGALKELQRLRDIGERRALVISATGSGKTYLSAFDAKKFGGKYLYLVHRRPILSKSMNSFKKVFGRGYRIEEYDPESNNLDVDCLFCTVQTMSKPNVLNRIDPLEFDYILIDEVHHAGAETYQRIINHFKPKFMVGMTATPDRSDSYDIYGLFDHNIAYEIRLKQALDLNLICPFHYFGISDLKVDDDSTDVEYFNRLVDEDRVKHIIENIEYYGFCGDRVKGLVFCSTIKEAETLSSMFNRYGYRTVHVDGTMDKDYVNLCIERLESEESSHVLDYIFTADLFNEGVDIPSINQVVMLRPTKSPIVYIQQLGRGLRLHKEKQFVVILDFIGNYKKSFNIPLALSDDHSYNKSEIRRFVAVGDSIISGNSTISFDEISKSRIYNSIDSESFSDTKLLVEAYQTLKFKLGRIPKLKDFNEYGTIDALNILSKYKTYHKFLKTKEPDYKVVFTDDEVKVLEYLTKIIAPGKRRLELDALRIINSGCQNFDEELLLSHSDLTEIELDNIRAVFDGTFYRGKPSLLIDGKVDSKYNHMLDNPDFKDAIENILDLGQINYESYYTESYMDTNFVLNRMYTYDDVCRLMNWSSNVNAQNIGGYKYDPTTNTFSVFINYVKGDDVVESQRYDDHFVNKNTLIALSKSNESSDSKNMQRVRNHKENDMAIHLFIRKNKEDEGSKEFYYLGMMDFVSFEGNGKPVKILYKLHSEVRTDLYEYFNSGL